jgi:hypothetical protein
LLVADKEVPLSDSDLLVLWFFGTAASSMQYALTLARFVSNVDCNRTKQRHHIKTINFLCEDGVKTIWGCGYSHRL